MFFGHLSLKLWPGAGVGASAPDVPTGLVVTTDSATQLTANWDDMDGATSYIVYVDGVETATPTDSTTPLTGLTAATTYAITVAAVNSGGTSDQCAAVNGTTWSSLTSGLVSYWALDEESGTRVDSVGSNDLTDNNTVGTAAGMHDNAASFVNANAESLSVVASDLAAGGADWSADFWVEHTGQDYGGLLGTYTDHSGFGVFSRNNNTVDFYVQHGAGADRVIVNAGCTPNVWHHVYIEWIDATNTAGISIDNAALVTGVSVNGYTQATAFKIGGNLPGLVDMTGLIDEPEFHSRALIDDERTELYASGAGKYYNGTNFV